MLKITKNNYQQENTRDVHLRTMKFNIITSSTLEEDHFIKLITLNTEKCLTTPGAVRLQVVLEK